MSVTVFTFGCRLNAYESEVIRGHAAALDDTVVINTCAVTAEAERQARQAIRRVRRERPGAKIVVTGCAAQLDPEGWGSLPGVARVLGNLEKLRPESWVADAGSSVSDIMAAGETAGHLVTEFAGRARAFVQVQGGCDHRCTFCVIPFGRGPNRSVPIGAVVAQARGLVAAGFRELVLTGVDIASYGADLPGRPALGQLARRLLALVPDLPRLRLGHQHTPSPFTLLGTKGVGESGVSGALASMLNAVNDALAPLGVRAHRLPLNPPNILAAIQAGANR